MSLIERRRRLRRAGRGAHERYELETKAWRRRNRRFFGFLTAVVSVVVVGSIVLLASRDLWAWIGGLVAGTAVAFLVALRESPPPWIENYRRGGWGEERTARALEPLTRRGWSVLHDLRWGGGNFDHVVIGPAGVFVLDTKNWSGEARFNGQDLWVRRPSDQRGKPHVSLGRAARSQARQLHDWLLVREAGRHWVRAVVVLWMDFDQQVAAGSNVTFVHGNRLAAWLDEQPPKFSAARVSDIANRLEAGQRRAPRTSEYELAAGDAPATS